MPTWEQLQRVLLLEDYNTRVVVIGVMALGMAAGLIGTFLLLRKRALTADALSHATLPGIAIAFMVMVAIGGDGKTMFGLLSGAFIFGCIGVLLILAIRSSTRLKDDAAIGIVLSVLFGLGLCLLKIASQLPSGSAAGLNHFIFGKAASMLSSETLTMVALAAVVTISTALLRKEFTVLCFDSKFGASQGWPVTFLDILLMMLVAIVTVIALQSVGLVLAVALLIIPAASARFWTRSVHSMLIASAIIGCLCGWLGAVVSALIPRMPTGPIIVLVCGFWFILSMVVGTNQGILKRQVSRWKLNRRIGLQHILRAMFEVCESTDSNSFPIQAIVQLRSWSEHEVKRLLHRAEKLGLITLTPSNNWLVTSKGQVEGKKVARNHRLWEVYLITYADIAPSHVDRDADMIEHVLGSELVAKLESLLEQSKPIASPHPLGDV